MVVTSVEKFSAWRKEGDSNPRYGNPHGSLANCWFQPLTHPSMGLQSDCQALFLKCGAKVVVLFCSAKFLHRYFVLFVKKRGEMKCVFDGKAFTSKWNLIHSTYPNPNLEGMALHVLV